MTVRELYDFLDNKIPASLSCDWDNDGLMCCPDGDAQVKKVLIALDITERTVDYAIDNGFDTIISHHPLIFSKVAQLNEDTNTARKLIRLVRNGVSAMSFHTRLDAVCGGVNTVLAKCLGFDKTECFGPAGEEFALIGELDEPTSADALCLDIKKRLSCPLVLCADCGKAIKKVAILGGDGKDYVNAAMASGADAFVSGRFSYNIMAEAPEKGITLIEAGHFFTEDPVCRRLEELVCEFDSNIETKIINSNEIKVL